MVVAVVSGCGGSSSSSSSASATQAAASGSASGGTDVNKVVVPGVPTLAQLYSGSYTTPPSTSPPGAKGKSVWWISCGQATPACAAGAAAAGQAAKSLGINFHIADGKFNVGGGFTTAVNTALAAKPDAMLLYGVDCESTRGALERAKAAGVLVLGVETPDCSDTGGPKLFTVDEIYSTLMPTVVDLWKTYGKVSADYVIDASAGHAKIIDNAGTEALMKFADEGFRAELAKCTGCSIVTTVPFDSATLTPNGPWIQAFRTALVKHPEANAVYFLGDVQMNALGGAQAIATTGRHIISFGGQGSPDGLAVVRAGKITAISSARSPGWSGYAAMDTINRALQGKPLVPEGLGFALVTPGHGLPSDPTASYVPAYDFESAYVKAWGAK
jgi:ribose transport system substrate-binding protein